MASDLPPAYNSLHTSTANIDVTDELVPNCDDGTELGDSNSFDDKNTRIGFIQKVLTIQLLQLFLMALVLGICLASDYAIHMYMRYSGGQVHLIVLSTLAFLATTGLLIYCTEARRENPYRYLFLVIHPLTLAFFITFPSLSLWALGSICLAFVIYIGGVFTVLLYSVFALSLIFCFVPTHTILTIMLQICLAFVTYIGAVFAVLLYSVFALQTKLEFAAKHAIVLAGAVQILIYALTVPFIYVDGFLVLYLGLTLSLHYMYVFWDLEIMTSKKYWHDITPDNFVDGALNLQLDYYYMIINIVMPQVRKSLETRN